MYRLTTSTPFPHPHHQSQRMKKMFSMLITSHHTCYLKSEHNSFLMFALNSETVCLAFSENGCISRRTNKVFLTLNECVWQNENLIVSTRNKHRSNGVKTKISRRSMQQLFRYLPLILAHLSDEKDNSAERNPLYEVFESSHHCYRTWMKATDISVALF